MTTPRATRKPPAIRENIPAPSTPEGELFHYTPEEVEEKGYLPFSARKLREMAYKREIPHVNNGKRITFSGLNIRAISAQFTNAPLTKPAKSAA